MHGAVGAAHRRHGRTHRHLGFSGSHSGKRRRKLDGVKEFAGAGNKFCPARRAPLHLAGFGSLFVHPLTTFRADDWLGHNGFLTAESDDSLNSNGDFWLGIK
jgi:hypothetical protein